MSPRRRTDRSPAVRDALADQLRAMARCAPDPAAFLRNREGIREAIDVLYAHAAPQAGDADLGAGRRLTQANVDDAIAIVTAELGLDA